MFFLRILWRKEFLQIKEKNNLMSYSLYTIVEGKNQYTGLRYKNFNLGAFIFT